LRDSVHIIYKRRFYGQLTCAAYTTNHPLGAASPESLILQNWHRQTFESKMFQFARSLIQLEFR